MNDTKRTLTPGQIIDEINSLGATGTAVVTSLGDLITKQEENSDPLYVGQIDGISINDARELIAAQFEAQADVPTAEDVAEYAYRIITEESK